MPLSSLRKIAAEPYFNNLYEFQKAIQKAIDNSRKSIVELIKIKRRIRDLGDIELKPKPLLDGHELIKLGAVAGPVLGQLSQDIYIEQLEGTLNNKTQAKEWAKKWLTKHNKT
jgi:poly(A) polymerase